MAHLCNKGSVLWPPQESAGVETSCVSIPGGLGPDLQCKHQREGMSPQPQWTMSPHPSSPLSSPPTISWEHRAGVIHHCIITIFQVNWGWVNKIRAHSKLQKKQTSLMSLCFPVDLKVWKAGLFVFSVKIVSVSKFYCVNALGSMYILWYFYRLENYMIQNDSGIKYDHKVTPVVAEKMEILTYIWHMACSQIMDLCSLVLSSCMIWFLSRKIIFSNFYCS